MKHASLQSPFALSPPKYLIALAAGAAVYFLTAKYGLSLAFGPKPITAVWPPTGLALALLLLGGERFWPSITVGAFLANVSTPDETLFTAFAIAIGNTLEAYVGSRLLRRFGFDLSISRLRDVVLLVGCAVLGSTMISATIGVTSLSLALPQLYPFASYLENWVLWWVGDAMGALIVTPFLLTWADRKSAMRRHLWSKVEAAFFFLTLTASAVILLASSVLVATPMYQQKFLLLPFFIWGAIRFDARVISSAVLIVSAIAIWGVTNDVGAFAVGSPNQRLMLALIFISVLSITSFAMSATRAQLLLSEERFRRTFNQQFQFMAIVSPEGVLLEVNNTPLQAANLSREEVIGKLFWETPWWNTLPHMKEAWPLRLKQAMACDVPIFTKDTYCAANGEIRTANAATTAVKDDAGRVRFFIIEASDTTEQKRIEQQLIAAKEAADHSNRLKDQFLAIVSHELRTPLTAMLGFTRLLRTGRISKNQVDHALEAIERNVRIQTQLVDDLLDVSKIASGKLQLRLTSVNLAHIIRSSILIVEPAAKAKGIEVQTSIDEVYTSGDPDRLQQVMWNLLSNAIKFTPKNGTVQVSLARSGAMARISITDNGIGIDPHIIPELFKIFQQADSTTTRQFGGLGLGLAIVKQLVELHGGEVTASSAGEGRGATFTVTLPISTAAPDLAEAALAPSSGNSLKGMQLLVVDDEPDARELLKVALENAGATVFAAQDADTAVELLRSNITHVIICDIGMPFKDGYTFMQEVRQMPLQLASTPAIALTAFSSTENHGKAMRAGFNRFVKKPVDPDQLIREILEVRSVGHKAAEPAV
ncbi:MAG TPA: MASE1 domain-containing protein [Planctomycetota bacterium]|nr:MASE1 domain-containing protein [Planctomycetota bacterium]